jgi:molybdenum cofactor guanylyltransferase
MIAKNQLREIKGLILCGGHSKRMGFDKSTIKYKRQLLYERLAEELKKTGVQPYISCRTDQLHLRDIPYDRIEDKGEFAGPAAGLLTAMKEHPDYAWLVLPCDMPLLTYKIFMNLLARRDTNCLATAYLTQHPNRKIIHPLPAIYEPEFRDVLERELNAGNWSLRKILEKNKVHLIKPVQPDKLVNLNRPEDLNRV